MFINFKKYTFQECMERLKKEIDTVYNAKKSTTTTPNEPQPPGKHDKHDNDDKHHENEKPTTTTNNNYQKVLNWSQTDVEKWLETKSINLTIVNNLKPCDGRILYQMYRILQSAPEFFYCAMKTDANSNSSTLSLKDLALFVYELTALFN